MKRRVCLIILLGISGLFLSLAEEGVKLLSPDVASGKGFNQLLRSRRSVRSYKDSVLSLKEISDLCFSAQGISDAKRGFRTVASAGAIYPLSIYLVVKEKGVKGLKEGIYLYYPESHSLSLMRSGDYFDEVIESALNQAWMKGAGVIFIITGDDRGMKKKYKDRAERYILIEAGMSAQNILLQAVNLGLGACPIGAFYDEGIAGILGLRSGEKVLILIPVGRIE